MVLKHVIRNWQLTDYFSHWRNTSNTRDSVSSGYPDTEKRAENTSIFDEIRGVWIANETLSEVFDISAQSKPKTKK